MASLTGIDPHLAQDTRLYPFPQDDISPKKKEGHEWNLNAAKAIWGFNLHYHTGLFYRSRHTYRTYLEYALGRQDQEKYKPYLGIEPNANEKTWLRAISFQIKNYATKRVNIAVSKMMDKDYDPVVSTHDPLSRNIRANIENRLRLQMKNAAMISSIEKQLGVKISDQLIPKDEEQLKVMMDTDFRMAESIHLELAIPHHLAQNRYEQIRKQMDFDLFVYGAGCMYVGMDENLRPTIERVHPADLVVPYNENPDFDNVPYIARVKWYTGSEFRKLAAGYISDTEIDRIIKEFSKKPSEDYNYTEDFKRYDDVGRIAILHYNYKSADKFTFLQKPDQMGNQFLYEKPIDYYARPKEIDKFKKRFGDSRKIIRQEVNAVYEGFWVIGSNTVIRHGRRGYSTGKYGNMADDNMGFKIYAPNSWDGITTSTAAQMIPNLDELQRYNLKMQQLVSRAIPKGIGIDLYALRKANLKWGNKEMSDQQKIEMFMKSGIFIYSSKDRYAAGSNYRPFYEVENGLAQDIEKYLRLIQQALFELDEIIGINKATAASQLREDAGKGVTELQIEASETALDYLYKADKTIYTQVCQCVGVLHIKSYKYSEKNRARYTMMFGDTGVQQSTMNFDLFNYDINIEAQPTQQQWNEIYLSAEKAYDKGILSYSDTLFLREITSIKQARRWLMMKETQAQERASQAAQENAQINAQTQQQSLDAKHANDMALKEYERQTGLILESAKRETILMQKTLDAGSKEEIQIMEGGQKSRQIEQQGEIDKELKILDERLSKNE